MAGSNGEPGDAGRGERRVFDVAPDEEVAEELAFHLAMRQRELEAGGLPAEAARAEALRRAGDLSALGEELRGIARRRDRTRRRVAWLRDAGADARFGLRRLRRSPAFTVAAVLTLGLGIGATTAIYSVVDAVLLRPLAYAQSDRLVVPYTQPEGGVERWAVTYADYEDWRASQVFDEVALYRRQNVNVAGDDESERVAAVQMTTAFFETLGVRPRAGGLFHEGDFAPGAARRAILSDALWQRRFGGDAGIIGRTVQLGGRAVEVAGVIPPGMAYPADVDVWLPLQVTPEQREEFSRRDNFIFGAVARLRPNRTLVETQAELTAHARRVQQTDPVERSGLTQSAAPLVEHMVGTTATRALWILLGAVASLLLIACVNVANLVVARSAERTGELAVRAGLGASRGRLARQLFTEGVVLALLGGAVGVLLAHYGVRVLVAAAPAQLPRLEDAGVSAAMLAFAAAVALAAAVLFGLAPALRLSREATAAVARGAQRVTAGVAARRRRDALVAAELALSVVLLVGAALLLRSFANLRATDPGFETAALVTFSVSLQGDRYPDAERRHAAFHEIRERLDAVAGVDAVSAVSALPLGGGGGYLGRLFLAEGAAEPPSGSDVRGFWHVAQPGYFSTLGVPLLRGRDFDARDRAETPPVAIVSRAFARAMFGDDEAIGRRVRSWRDENVYREIIGIVEDVRIFGVEDDPGPSFYVPHTQDAWSGMVFVVRTRGETAGTVSGVRAALREYDRGIAMAGLRTMHDVFAASLAPARFIAFVLAFFAAVALILVAVGVYGVIASGVAQRTREIGIRMALGARQGSVLRMVLREAGVFIAIGTAAGVGAALMAARTVGSLLHGIRATDPVIIAAVVLVLGVVSFAATLIPARRAAAIDPGRTLRSD